MFIESTNFRDFFRDQFFRHDRKYVDISMRSVLKEMAVPMDIAKLPIKIDKDDIEFLQQFDPKYWTQALHQRYHDDLADALEERNTRRAPLEKKLYGRLKSALYNGTYNSLQGVVSNELMTRLNNGQYGHVVGEDDLVDQAARKLAETEAEKEMPHASWPHPDENLAPGFKRYKFKKSRNSSETVTIVAKPFMNRLIHKLERTRGHEHHMDSGLAQLGTTHGQYGYDLYGLKRGDEEKSHATRGMKFPTAAEIGARMGDFLGHNAHRMYGELPQGDDIVWKPVGDGRTIYKDNHSWRKVFEPLYSLYMAKLQSAEPGTFTLPDGTKLPPEGGFHTNSQRTSAARKLAMEEVFKKAEAGEIVGPPIPGVAPHGLPVKVKMSDDKKVIDAPPLYLPHKKKEVRVETDGGVQNKIIEVPLVNPTQYLRQLGSEEGDESLDADQLRGYKKDYVHVNHNDYRKAKGYVAGGALHVNQNSGGRMYMDPSDTEYADRKSEIEEQMGTVGLDGNNRPSGSGGEGQFFFDIIKGIWNCIDAQACGGATSHEKSIMKQNVPDLHTMVYQKMMMNLRDERLDSAGGRRKFAKDVTASWAQQDLGQGGDTRRKRKLTDKGRQTSFDTTGGENDDLSLADAIQKNMKGVASNYADNKRGKGDKLLPAGQHQFSYHLDNYRKIIEDMEKEAEKVDSERDQAVKMSKAEISDQIAELLGDAITEKAALVLQLQFYIKQLYMASGYQDGEAEGFALQKVEQYTSNRASAKQIVAAFKADNSIQEMLKSPDAESGSQSALAQGEVEKIEKIIDQMDDAGTLNNKQSQDLVYQYISTHVPPEAQAACIAFADEQFGRQTPQKPATIPSPTAPAAPAAAPATAPAANQPKVKDLIGSQNWLAVARHPAFLQHADVGQLTKIIGKLEGASGAMADSFERDDHEFALIRLRNKLKEKQNLT